MKTSTKLLLGGLGVATYFVFFHRVNATQTLFEQWTAKPTSLPAGTSIDLATGKPFVVPTGGFLG